MARGGAGQTSRGLNSTRFTAKCVMQLESIKDVGEVMPLPAAQFVAKRARARAHVITGYMRDHIHAQQTDNLGAVVKSEATYSGFEEYGTRFRPAHPFLRPSIEDGRREIPKLTAKEVNAEIRRRVNRA